MSAAKATTPLRVMIVEDHTLVRAAIKSSLNVPGIRVVSDVATAEDALGRVAQDRPDVMLIDIDLPGMDGVELVHELAPRLPDTHMVILTASANKRDLVAAIRAGAAGYLTKGISPEGLVRAVLGVPLGDLPMPRHLARELVEYLVAGTSEHELRGGLSARETQVVSMISEGMTNREIGAALGISPRTVGRHVGNVLEKLGAKNRAAAARLYFESR
jgi:DNA-binding NarL/FixJ family response regulator